MPLDVIALIPAKPGSEDVVRDALRTLVAATRQEEGCVTYDLHESQAAPGTFVTVEVWRDREALDGHMRTPHIAEALTSLADHVAGAPAIHPLTPVG